MSEYDSDEETCSSQCSDNAGRNDVVVADDQGSDPPNSLPLPIPAPMDESERERRARRFGIPVVDGRGSHPTPHPSHPPITPIGLEDVNYIRGQLGLNHLPFDPTSSTNPQKRLTSAIFCSTGTNPNGTTNPNGDANGSAKLKELLDYVRLDHIRNADGNWVTKRTEEPIAPKEDEFSGYSFSVLRNWDYRGVSRSNDPC
jgi:hypothetical protein